MEHSKGYLHLLKVNSSLFQESEGTITTKILKSEVSLFPQGYTCKNQCDDRPDDGWLARDYKTVKQYL